MSAGALSTALDIAPNALTFHFDRLRKAGLVSVRREGRSMIYAAQYATINSLLQLSHRKLLRWRGKYTGDPKIRKPIRKRTKVAA